MKMVMAVVPRDDTECVLQALVAAGHTATFVESRGGVLRQAKKMLFIAVQAKDLDQVLTIIEDSCHCQEQAATSGSERGALSPEPAPVTAGMGGTPVFVWDLDRFEIY
jgi:uncharacterized protein YaaQ